MPSTDGTTPAGYTAEGVAGYLRASEGAGTVALARHVNAATGSHYYSTTADAPAGYTAETTLGYLDTAPGEGLAPLARFYNASTGDYLLDTATTPPGGYTLQATLGYVHLQQPPTPGSVTYTYDTGVNGKGRRSTMADLAGSASYTYDALGRITSATRITDGVAYATQSTYTVWGSPATITYPDGEVLTYGYDAAGQVTSVVGATTYVSSMTYDATGQLTQVTYGNGAVTTYAYSPTTLRLTSLVTSQGASSLQQFSYAYDNVGNITALTDTRDPANTQTFAYDNLNRLTSATGAYGAHTYTYDSIGNILGKAGMTYTYGATAQTCARPMPHAVTSTSDGKSYTYDCNGNLVSDGERSLTWDADNKPVSITRTGVGTTTFAYSGDGARLKKVGPSRTIRYVGGFEDHITDAVQVKHILAGSLRVATRVVGGTNPGTYFIHGDHLGSLNVLTNSSGSEVQRLTYRPFGETHSNQGSVDFLQRRYTGQEEDPETGLYFYHARYYNPALGRFISPDSLVPEPGNPQSLNRYSYVENNPVNRIDPSGHSWFSKLYKGVLRPILRIEIPVMTVVASVVAGMIFQQYWAVPLIAAVGSAANTYVNGGNFGQAARAGGIAAAASLAGVVVGGVVGGAIYSATGSTFAATVGGAAAAGAAGGATAAALGGGDVGRGAAVGAVTAAAFAMVAYAAVAIYNSSGSPALEGYETQDAAARAALSKANPLSIRDNVEYGGLIYGDDSGRYGYTGPIRGAERGVNPFDISIPEGTTLVGEYHTHGDYSVVDIYGNVVRTSNPGLDSFNAASGFSVGTPYMLWSPG